MTLALPKPVDSCLVYTPTPLASAIVNALAPEDTTARLSWLEPSVGTGVFLQALAQRGVGRGQITALDLDPTPAPGDRLARTRRPRDFIQWARRTPQRFDRIIANPPYVAVRELPPALRDPVLQLATPDGIPVAHRANYWYAFLCASLSLLRPGGSLGFVLPAAWCYANYARPLRTSIASWFREVQVHRSENPLFEGIQDGSVVLLAFDHGHGPGRLIEQLHQRPVSLYEAVRTRRISHRPAAHTPRRLARRALPRVPLREVFTIRIGGVTGDSSFFLMTDAQRIERGLPAAACRPVLSRSRHLTAAELDDAAWVELRDAGQRVWLFCPPPRLLAHPKVRAYMELPPEQGGCRREHLKLRRRGDTWYRTPMPPTPDGFMSGMSYHMPWIAFRRMRGLVSTNTLYTVRFKNRKLSASEQAGWALTLLSTAVRRQLEDLVRRYPDGLCKVEPGDMYNLSLPQPPSGHDLVPVYRDAIARLLARETDAASALADAVLSATKHKKPAPSVSVLPSLGAPSISV